MCLRSRGSSVLRDSLARPDSGLNGAGADQEVLDDGPIVLMRNRGDAIPVRGRTAVVAPVRPGG